MQGTIKAMQPLQIPENDVIMEMQSSWISVANVSFADMLCSVDKRRDSPRNHRDSPRNRRGGPSRAPEAAGAAREPASCSEQSTCVALDAL